MPAALHRFLDRHPKLRSAIRWLRWQTKKVPGLDRISIAIDTAYFKDVSDERPPTDEYAGEDPYLAAYSQFLISRTYGRVLDVGCGHGYLTVKIAAHPRVTSVVGVDKIADFRSKHANVEYRTNDITGPEDFPGKFDVIVASEFVEHLSEEDHKKVLIKIAKALKPDGIYIGSTPRNPTRFKTFSGSRWHVREYNEKDLAGLLRVFFNDVRVTALSEYGLAWEAKGPKK